MRVFDIWHVRRPSEVRLPLPRGAEPAADDPEVPGAASPPLGRRSRHPAVVFGMLIIAAVVFCLFDAQVILSAARSVPAQRGGDIAVAVAQPLADLSSFLRLDRPREFVEGLSASHTIEEVIVPTAVTTAPPAPITTGTAGATGTEAFVAELTGSQEIPPVDTTAHGHVSLTVAADGASADFVLELTDIVGLTSVNLRQGATGQDGPVLAPLYSAPRAAGGPTDVGTSGTIGSGDLTGPLAGMSIADLAALIRDGQVYVEVETTRDPGGEIRGDLR